MKLKRTIAMHTDYTYHGIPCETSCVELYVDESVTDPKILAELERIQEERLHHMTKRMPPRYWRQREAGG